MPLPQEVIEAAAARYRERTPIRERNETLIAQKRFLEIEPEEQNQRRVGRLARSAPVRELLRQETGTREVLADPAAALHDLGTRATLERMIGENNLLGVAFLTRGARVASTVSRLLVGVREGRVQGYGTGSLVSPRLLLTNHHVFPEPDEAARSLAQFHYEVDELAVERTSSRFELRPDELFLTDPALDYTLVAVDSRSLPSDPEAASLSQFGYNRLDASLGKINIGESVNIIQHPNGRLKQVIVQDNRLVDKPDHFLHYHADTLPGSSGSPLFNNQWEVVGLHHSGVPRTDAEGRWLCRDGSLWRPGMSDDMIDWIANEGARISAILASLRARRSGLSAEAQRLLDELLANSNLGIAGPVGPGSLPRRDPSPSPSPSPEPERDPSALHLAASPAVPAQVTASGGITLTIPLQIHVSLGQPDALHEAPTGARETPETPAVIQPAPFPATDTGPPGLAEAFAEFERSRTRPYYDVEEDERARDTFYRRLDPERLSGTELYQALSALLEREHRSRPEYAPGRELYPWVDLQPDYQIRSLYTLEEYEPRQLIRETLLLEERRARELAALRSHELTPDALERAEAALEASLPYNCEHVVPQSWFRKEEPMKGDLHHLFTCEVACNRERGNLPYQDFPATEERVIAGCGEKEQSGFEPANGKGPAARATLYFLLRYAKHIGDGDGEFQLDRLETLLEWHEAEPPGLWERHRNAAIHSRQGNRNPLIDFPDWARRIDFTAGFG